MHLETRGDGRTSRQAGGFIGLGKRGLFRVCQDCEDNYGSKIHVLKVESLGKNKYLEKRVRTIEPPAGFSGIHTYNVCDGVEVADGRLEKRSFLIFVKNLFWLVPRICEKVKTGGTFTSSIF